MCRSACSGDRATSGQAPSRASSILPFSHAANRAERNRFDALPTTFELSGAAAATGLARAAPKSTARFLALLRRFRLRLINNSGAPKSRAEVQAELVEAIASGQRYARSILFCSVIWTVVRRMRPGSHSASERRGRPSPRL